MAINAQLLQVNDLSNILAQRGQQADQQWTNNMNALGSLAQTGANAYDQVHINEALSKNFDPVTGKLNQEAVIKDLYNFKPQLAQKMSQDYMAQNMNNQKVQGDINKTTAETGKLNAEAGKQVADTGSVQLKNLMDQNNQLGQLVMGTNDQAGLDKVLQFAKSKGLDTSLYDGATFSPKLKQQVMAQIIDANNQIKNQIDQQNANSGTMNALTNQQKNSQDYEINTNKNMLDNRRVGTEESLNNARINEINNNIATKGMLTPQQSLEYKKAENELDQTKIEKSNKIQTGINNLSKANKTIDLFAENAKKLLNNPLISSGIDPQTGQYMAAQDTLGVVGGVWSDLRSNDSTLNPFNKGTNEYKQFKAEWDRFALQARGKGLSDLKSQSADGSAGLGGASDMEGKMLGVMQNVPDAETAFKMNPQERLDILTGIMEAAKEDKANNQALIDRAKSQGSVIANQSVPKAPQRGPNQMVITQAIPENMPKDNYNNIQVGAPLPPLKDTTFKASNGYVLTPKMYAKILAQQGK